MSWTARRGEDEEEEGVSAGREDDSKRKLGLCPPEVEGAAETTRSGKTTTMNWELNERISLSSGSSPGLEVRPDARRGIELTGNRKKDAWSWRGRVGTGLELMNVSGFQQQQQGEQDKRRGRDASWPIEADLMERKEKGGVIKSDSKYEIGIPGSGDPGSGSSGKRRQQVSSGCGSSKSRSWKGEKEGEKGESGGGRKWVGGRKKTEKTNDSISKRLELIHELNQKILANYERFQQRSRSKNRGTKEGKCDTWRSKKEQGDGGGRSRGSTNEAASREARKEEDAYAEARRKGSRGAKPAQRSCEQDSCSRERKMVDVSRLVGFSKDHRVVDKKRSAKTSPSSTTSSSSSSSKSRAFRDNENFTMAARPGFYGAEDKKEAECCGGSRWSRNGERKSGFPSVERKGEGDREVIDDTDRLGSSRLYPERCNGEARVEDFEGIERGDDETKEREEGEKGSDRLAIEDRDETPQDLRRGYDTDAERVFDEGEEGEEEKKKKERGAEEESDEKRKKAAASTGKKKKRRDKLENDGARSSGGCSTSGEPTSGPKVARLQETFDSSWDSGVGADVGNGGSGWVRIHTGIESSLVYLTVDTTARDVCRDMLLGDDLSLFMQVSGPRTSVANYSFDLRRKGCARPPRLMRGTNMLMRNCCSI